MKKLLLICILFTLASCAAWSEMGQTGEPPPTLVNQYKATVKMVEEPRVTREIWNFVARKLRAATEIIDSEGIDLVIEHPEPEE